MKSRVLLLAVVGCLAVTAPALAVPSHAMFAFTNVVSPGDVELVVTGTNGTTVLNAIDSGWFSELGNHIASNDNYIVGVCGDDACNGDSLNRNDYFVFDLGSENLGASSAVLRLMNPPNAVNAQNGYISTNPSELYQVFDVSTNPVDLMADQSGETGIFDDLGSGVSFGNRLVSAADNGTFVEITLNSDAIAALNSSTGNWAIGGTLTAEAPVPEPTTLLLLGSGLLVGGRLRRRR